MSTLYVKVSIARRPTSNRPRAIRLVAGYDERLTMRNAVCYAELGFAQLTADSIQEVVARFRTEARARQVQLNIAGEVSQMI